MRKTSSFLIYFGILPSIAGLSILIFTFYPVILLEVGYRIKRPSQDVLVTAEKETDSSKLVVRPLDRDFGIIIPKINANAKVVTNVDPYNAKEYQRALTSGVAHAKGAVFPGENGNVFIFSHSSVNFYEAARYNSIFYLLSKMEKGDEIYLFYKKETFKYKVSEKKIVEAGAVNYLQGDKNKKTLTLMTCWPPGTTFRRLIVIGEMINN